ncbi:hypothetical protein EDC01DRAFT_385621 [Geopyxis carbonaria]|nr:hypothetical protein EDC01DRAFT_385621 [Geopyxis carbonaria]
MPATHSQHPLSACRNIEFGMPIECRPALNSPRAEWDKRKQTPSQLICPPPPLAPTCYPSTLPLLVPRALLESYWSAAGRQPGTVFQPSRPGYNQQTRHRPSLRRTPTASTPTSTLAATATAMHHPRVPVFINDPVPYRLSRHRRLIGVGARFPPPAGLTEESLGKRAGGTKMLRGHCSTGSRKLIRSGVGARSPPMCRLYETDGCLRWGWWQEET